MSYRNFSTDKADYFLVYTAHFIKADGDILRQPKLDDLDAIVLETGFNDYKDGAHIPQYSEIKRNIKASKKNIPFYFVDIIPDIGGTLTSSGLIGLQVGVGVHLFKGGISGLRMGRRRFIKDGLKALLGTAICGTYLGQVLNSSHEGKAAPVLPELATALLYMPPTPMAELRNAITARKTEEFIAPKLKEEKGKKPLIALVYGGMHAGLEADLKHKWLRDLVIDSYKAMGYLGIEKENLNAVLEVHLKTGYKKEYKVNLF